MDNPVESYGVSTSRYRSNYAAQAVGNMTRTDSEIRSIHCNQAIVLSYTLQEAQFLLLKIRIEPLALVLHRYSLVKILPIPSC